MSKRLPEGWPEVRLEDCCEVILGQSPPGESYNAKGDGLPFFQGKADFGPTYPTVRKWCTQPKKRAAKDDILISVRAPVGPTNLCPDDACIGRGLAALRPLGSTPSRYILYALRNSQAELAALGTGSTFEAINGDQLRSHRIPLAPFPLQMQIVSEIEKQFARLDNAVAALKRVQANLKRYRASVLKAACEGRLVPTEAELARQEGRSYETGEQLLQRALGLKPQVMQGRWPLPGGWCWASVGEVGEVQLGRQRAPQHHSGPYMRPYLRVANVFDNRIDTSDVLEMNFTPKEYERYELKPGDILLNEGQSLELVGRAAMYGGELPGACFQKTLLRFRASSVVVPSFALVVFMHYLHSKQFQTVARRSVNMAHLTAERFIGMGFPLPPRKEQERILQVVDSNLREAERLSQVARASLNRSSVTRKAILQLAFSGRLIQGQSRLR